MSKKIIKDTPLLGQLILVENQDKHILANDKYLVQRVQTPNKKYKIGKYEFESHEEIYLAFTEKEIEEAYERAMKNPEDCPEVSILRDFWD